MKRIRIKIIQHIYVDKCIAKEIKQINRKGVRTESSCCGHGFELPNAIIRASSFKRAVKLGYETEFSTDIGAWMIKLKSKCRCRYTGGER